MEVDLRLAVRRLAKERSLTIAAVLTLAIGIGACTAMFSIVEAVLLKSMGIGRPGDLLVLWPQFGDTAGEFSYNAYRALNRPSAVFEAVTATGSTNWPVPVDILLPDGRHARATQSAVSATFFDVLRARPLLGRTFVSDDDRPGAPATMVLSTAFWRDKLAGDPTVINRALTIGRDQWRIIGVMPPEFFYPSGADFWTPAAALLAMTAADKSPAGLEQLFSNVGAFHVLARLKPGTTMRAAQADATRLWKTTFAAVAQDESARVAGKPFLDHVFGSARRALWLLMAAVVLVLLTACANVTGLLIARNALRGRDVAIRTALGASPWQLARQSLIESGVVAVAGGVLGLGIAVAAFRTLIALSPGTVVRLSETRLDSTVLIASVLIISAVTMVIGLVPALPWRRSSVVTSTHGMSMREAGPIVRARTRHVLVVGQVAITLLLLVASVLAGRNFLRLMTLDLGFNPSNVLTFDLSQLDQSRYSTYAMRRRVVDDLIVKIEHLPNVRAAAAVLQRPFGHGVIGWDSGLLLDGQADVESNWLRNPILNFEAVSAKYLRVMGIRLLRGRDFSSTDRSGQPPIAIVSDNLVARLWPGQDPIGKRLLDSFVGRGKDGRPSRWLTVVGVVGAARYRELDRLRFDLYVPLAQADEFDAEQMVVKTAGDPRSLTPQLAAILSNADPQLTVADVTTMDDVVRGVRAPWRFNMLLFGAFGCVSIGLTAIAIVGLVISTVNWRRKEIGVRLALGAQARQVVLMITFQGFKLVAVGAGIGVLAAWLALPLLSNLWVGLPTNDFRTLIGVAAGVVILSGFACYLPARRAAASDPCVVFRDE